MSGIGPVEAGVILVLVLLVFAPTLVAFFVGYTMGQRKSASEDRDAPEPAPSAQPAPAPSDDHEAADE